MAGADAVLVAVPGPAVTDVLAAAGPLDGKIIIDAANMMGQSRLSLRQLADAFPAARWVRAFNTLQARVLADENHRLPRWVLFLSGDEQAKAAVVQLIADTGFEPVDLGGIDDSQFQEPGSALWNTALESGNARALAARVRSGHAEPADPLTAPFEKLRDHAPDDPEFFFEHLCRAVFQAGMSWPVISAKWDGIREAFHGFDPDKVATLQPPEPQARRAASPYQRCHPLRCLLRIRRCTSYRSRRTDRFGVASDWPRARQGASDRPVIGCR
jgi:8-hydroxy-5-deazaflavin:NADPH oxidoreductase